MYVYVQRITADSSRVRNIGVHDMRKIADITSRIAMGTTGAAILAFGFMGFSVAAMIGVDYPIANAIATSATASQGMFLAWITSGLVGLGCLVFAGR